MTGAPDANGTGVCALCGGRLATGVASVPFVRSERVIVVRAVPAQICGSCREPYFDGPTLDRVLALVERLDASGAEVSVMSFRAA
jgi:YgiT-type zinc finger domain-containing protein